jgi:hypothetical protein
MSSSSVEVTSSIGSGISPPISLEGRGRGQLELGNAQAPLLSPGTLVYMPTRMALPRFPSISTTGTLRPSPLSPKPRMGVLLAFAVVRVVASRRNRADR